MRRTPCSGVSGRNEIDEASSLPATKPGCDWANSGRAVATSTSGPEDRARIRLSMSSSCSPAQCRSSTAITSGARDA